MKIVNALVLSGFLASLALAQEVSPAPVQPQVEILFSYIGARTTQFVNTVEIPRTPGTTTATRLLPYRAELATEPLTPQSIFVNERQRQTTNYAYLRVRNASAKSIQAIVWEVPYLHVKRGQGQTRHEFRSKVKLAPSDTAKVEELMPRTSNPLRMTAISGPAGKFDLTQGGVAVIQSGDNQETPFDTLTYTAKNGLVFEVLADWQRAGIRIKRIEYTDGSVWQQ